MAERLAEAAWRVPVARGAVPETGRRFDLVADEETRAAVAKVAGLRALPRLAASFDLVPQGREGLRVTGRVSAKVGQTCVVTLDPIENEVDESIDLVFAPAAPPLATDEDPQATEDVVDDERPEPLVDGKVDLGAIATEFLILGLDPYPRKPGAVFEPPSGGSEGANPFAALAALKTKSDGK
jgi:uncharacterized metal-binding protein YceD (DUF177 family)